MNSKLENWQKPKSRLQYFMNPKILLSKTLFYSSIFILSIMNLSAQDTPTPLDNSKKRILARGCDPIASASFAKMVPPLVGNAEYVPTTDDTDFINKLKSDKWSVVFFAPGACRFSAAKHQIPGGNYDTQGWSLDDYKKLIHEFQGDKIQIVESLQEQGTFELLREALAKSVETK